MDILDCCQGILLGLEIGNAQEPAKYRQQIKYARQRLWVLEGS